MSDMCTYRVSAKALIWNGEKDKFLLSNDNGIWDFLGGGVEYKEDPIEALIREIREEVSLKVKEVQSKPSFLIFSERLVDDQKSLVLLYETTLHSFDIIPSKECNEIRFFSKLEAMNLPVYPPVRDFLKKNS